MKRISTLFLGLFAALALQAQSDFPIQFADKDGNIIADGTTLTITDVEEDLFGVLMPSGVYVKNTTNAKVRCAGSFTVQSISNGMFQSCFPNSCKAVTSKGSYITGDDFLQAGELKNMMTEWIPDQKGICTVVYQLVTFKENVITKQWNKDKEGPTITLQFVNAPDGVSSQRADKAVQAVEFYDLTGRRVDTLARGMFLVRTIFADGTTKCVKVRR
ncbi:MAG: hypothetical protein K6C30_07980 [Bacteroidaceae bacterium]|nr:hypothetical protein [Bacteroidaceae bacterium]